VRVPVYLCAKVEKTGVPLTVAVGYHPGGSRLSKMNQFSGSNNGEMEDGLHATSASQLSLCDG
jgi:hypothetical protein